MKDNNSIKIIFFGDIVGKPGRFAVRDFLAENKENYDFVIANVENASHGFGLTEKNYNEFIEYGIDAMTCGNHIWDKKDIYTYIDSANCLVRPLNYPEGTPGVGSRIFEKDGFKIGVINVLGRVFMSLVDPYWNEVAEEIKRIKEITPIVVLDFHAEATAEKVCYGKYCSELGLSAMFGTHTHVQTADECIINGMAYITDAGFCGAVDTVIGMEFETSLRRLSTSLPERYEISESPIAQINGVEVLIDRTKSTQIKRINVTVNNENNERGNYEESE